MLHDTVMAACDPAHTTRAPVAGGPAVDRAGPCRADDPKLSPQQRAGEGRSRPVGSAAPQPPSAVADRRSEPAAAIAHDRHRGRILLAVSAQTADRRRAWRVAGPRDGALRARPSASPFPTVASASTRCLLGMGPGGVGACASTTR